MRYEHLNNKMSGEKGKSMDIKKIPKYKIHSVK